MFFPECVNDTSLIHAIWFEDLPAFRERWRSGPRPRVADFCDGVLISPRTGYQSPGPGEIAHFSIDLGCLKWRFYGVWAGIPGWSGPPNSLRYKETKYSLTITSNIHNHPNRRAGAGRCRSLHLPNETPAKRLS